MENVLVSSARKIPNLSEKISFLLQELGCTQKWLAGELRLSNGRITQIKTSGKIPNTKYKKFCNAFCITPQELELDDFVNFKKQVRESFEKKGGIIWRAFTKAHSRPGLDVQLDPRYLSKKPSSSVTLKGLSSTRKPISMAVARQLVVSLGQQVEFNIPYRKISLNDDIEVATYVLLLEDENGLNFIAPLKQPSIPPVHQGAYFITNKKGGFYVSEPTGQHYVYFLLLSRVLPLEIVNDFESQSIGRAVDKLACWLTQDNDVHFSLNKTRFFVSP